MQCQILEIQSKLQGYNDKLHCDITATEQSLKNITNECFEKMNRDLESKINAAVLNWKPERDIQDVILHSLPKLICDEIVQKLTLSFLDEFKKHILPNIITRIEGIKEQIRKDIDRKQSTNDQVLLDSIAQVCSSKVI